MRQLLPALAASTALHVAVLAAAGSGRLSRRAPAAISIVDIELFAGPSAQSVHSSVHRAPLPEEAIPRSAMRRAVRRPERLPARAVGLPFAQAAAAAPAARAADIPVASIQVAGLPAPIATMGRSPSPMTAVAELDLTAFFERLQRAAQRCSGPRAGEGKVRFCVGADGTPTQVSLVQSTGNFALDDAALHCVIPGAAPFPRTDRCLVVPLRFQ